MAFAVALTVLVSPARAAEPVQPGVFISTDEGGCTLGFIYQGSGGRTYASTAAHCVSGEGDEVRLGSGEVFGRVKLRGNPDVTAADWALIEVAGAYVSSVKPSVVGHPSTPIDFTRASGTRLGDAVRLSGHGIGFSFTSPTREGRVGILTYDSNSEHAVAAPLVFGDSGGPIVHAETGRALGIVSRLCFGVCTEMGPTVQGIIAQVKDKGYIISLQTV